MANAGVAPEIRQKLSGHTTEDAHQRYTELEMDQLRKAIKSIPSKKKTSLEMGGRLNSAELRHNIMEGGLPIIWAPNFPANSSSDEVDFKIQPLIA